MTKNTYELTHELRNDLRIYCKIFDKFHNWVEKASDAQTFFQKQVWL